MFPLTKDWRSLTLLLDIDQIVGVALGFGKTISIDSLCSVSPGSWMCPNFS